MLPPARTTKVLRRASQRSGGEANWRPRLAKAGTKLPKPTSCKSLLLRPQRLAKTMLQRRPQEDDAKSPDKDETKPGAAKTETKPATSARHLTQAGKNHLGRATEVARRNDGPSARRQRSVLPHARSCRRDRTATVQIDGPAGFKLWVNGEIGARIRPAATTSSVPQPKKDEVKKDEKADAKNPSGLIPKRSISRRS